MSPEEIGIKNKKKASQKSDSGIYEPLREKGTEIKWACERWHNSIFTALRETDEPVWQLVAQEFGRRKKSIQLLAAENQCSKAVLAALGSVLQDKTAEGPVDGRLHGGCGVVDQLEQIAIDRAKQVFGAKYANVQPHSGTQANQIVITALLNKGDKILSLPDAEGGHFSHGSAGSSIAKFYKIENYRLDGNCLLDYQAILQKVLSVRPKLIICGFSAYPRKIDFKAFREIAERCGSFLLADISHISGLVSANAHQSPIDYAHFTTTSTYKSGGPRGGLILMGKDFNMEIDVDGRKPQLWRLIEKSTFPGAQGTPYFNNIAAKAVFFGEMLSDEYKQRQFGIINNSKQLAQGLIKSGFNVVTGGTDNHLILVNVADFKKGLTGNIAQKVLERCGIVVDSICLPVDEGQDAMSGIRLGTAIVTKDGFTGEEMNAIALMIEQILRQVQITDTGDYRIDKQFVEQMLQRVDQLCDMFAPDNNLR
jgi:glycine hydroxymethyltransferase